MRDHVKKVISEDIITITGVAELIGADPQLVYRWVVRDKVCEHQRIGRSHVVIDREDIPAVEERFARSNAFKANRKATDGK